MSFALFGVGARIGIQIAVSLVTLLGPSAASTELPGFAGGVHVRNDAPTEVSPTAQATASQLAILPVDSQGAMAQRATAAANRFASALAVGVLGALAAMLALSAYALISPRVRAYLARMRTRRLYRDQDLTRTRGSNRG